MTDWRRPALHGHHHYRHDYRVMRAGRASTRVICNAWFYGKGETEGLTLSLIVRVSQAGTNTRPRIDSIMMRRSGYA
jgi:hypothetical protein